MNIKIVLVLLFLCIAGFNPKKAYGAIDGNAISRTESVKILSVDSFDDEAMSAYKPYSFRLSDEDALAVGWKFSIIGADDAATEVCRGSERVFEIPAIAGNSDFTPDNNGDMRGVIVCEYERSGVSQTISSDVTLSFKPVIVEIRNIEKHPIAGTGNFGLTFDVEYLGAEGVEVYVEQEYSSGITRVRVDEPSPAHVSIRSLAPIVYNWIDVTVTNSYGKDSETIELAPSSSGLKDVRANNGKVVVYSAQGTCLGSFDSVDALSSQLPAGLYITVQSGVPAKKIIIRR